MRKLHSGNLQDYQMWREGASSRGLIGRAAFGWQVLDRKGIEGKRFELLEPGLSMIRLRFSEAR